MPSTEGQVGARDKMGRQKGRVWKVKVEGEGRKSEVEAGK
jgi:hypothetical protein